MAKSSTSHQSNSSSTVTHTSTHAQQPGPVLATTMASDDFGATPSPTSGAERVLGSSIGALAVMLAVLVA